jgi:hypothetical protein
MPLTLTDPRSLTPTYYQLLYRRVKCSHCGIVHSYDDVLAMVAVNSGFTGIPIKSMAEIEYQLPVKVTTVEQTSVPFCHMCFHPDLLKGLPKADARRQRAAVVGGFTPGPNAKPQPKAKKEPKGPKTYTVDDLDID